MTAAVALRQELASELAASGAVRSPWLRRAFEETPRSEHVVSVELHPRLAEEARQALARLGLHPAVHTGDGAAGFAAAAPFDRIISTAATDHIPPSWISQLAPGGSIVVDLRGSLDGSLLRVMAIDSDVVEGPTQASTMTAALRSSCVTPR